MTEILDPLIYLAAFLAACGLFASRGRDRAAWALLASLIVVETMQRSGMAFHVVWWAMLDAAVFLFITMGRLTLREVSVLLLFFPAWLAYLLPEGPRYVVTAIVVIGQFLIVLPWQKAWNRAKETPPPCHENPFDMREVANV